MCICCSACVEARRQLVGIALYSNHVCFRDGAILSDFPGKGLYLQRHLVQISWIQTSHCYLMNCVNKGWGWRDISTPVIRQVFFPNDNAYPFECGAWVQKVSKWQLLPQDKPLCWSFTHLWKWGFLPRKKKKRGSHWNSLVPYLRKFYTMSSN